MDLLFYLCYTCCLCCISLKIMLQPQFGPINKSFQAKLLGFQNTPAICRSCRCLENDTNWFFLVLSAILSIDPSQFEAVLNRWCYLVTGIFLSYSYLQFGQLLRLPPLFRAADAFTKVRHRIYDNRWGPAQATEVFPLLVWKTAFSHLRFAKHQHWR